MATENAPERRREASAYDSRRTANLETLEILSRPSAIQPPSKSEISRVQRMPEWAAAREILADLVSIHGANPDGLGGRRSATAWIAKLIVLYGTLPKDRFAEHKGHYQRLRDRLRQDSKAFHCAAARVPSEPLSPEYLVYSEHLAGIRRSSGRRPIDRLLPDRSPQDSDALLRRLHRAPELLRELLAEFAKAATAAVARWDQGLRATRHRGKKVSRAHRRALVEGAMGLLSLLGVRPTAFPKEGDERRFNRRSVECGALVLLCARIRGDEPSTATWVRTEYDLIRKKDSKTQ